MLYQAGQILARTKEGDQSVLHVYKPSDFRFTSEVSEITAEGFPFDVSPIQTLDSAIARETYTLTLSQQTVDNLDLQMFMDEREQSNLKIDLPAATKVVVPDTAPYTVTVAGLSGLADQDVVAMVLSDTAPVYLRRVPNATTTLLDNEFKVGAADIITFDDAMAGKTVALNFLETHNNIIMQGGTNPRRQYGELSFSAIMQGTRIRKRLYIPRIQRTSGFNVGVAGDVQTTELTYKALTPAGWSVPYAMWTVAAAAVAV